jgi:hypothetical protein
MSNEIFVGAGASATMIPEAEIYLGATGTRSGKILTFNDTTLKLVTNLYQGCTLKIVDTNANPDETEYYTVDNNNETTITVDRTITGNSSTLSATMLGFGAPVPASKISTDSTLLSDNWLGLVNTITPPNVEVEMKQLNMAVGGGRNFDYQFKGAETVSGGSLDVSMNNGSWLYYALGKIKSITHTTHLDGGTIFTAVTTNASTSLQDVSDFTNVDIGDGITGTGIPAATTISAFNAGSSTITMSAAATATATGISITLDSSVDSLVNETAENTYINGTKLVRTLGGNEYPPVASQSTYVKIGTGTLAYTFEELDGDALPSFALEVSYNKATNTAKTVGQSDPNTDMFSRVFTGCQINTLTLNFEEGQEVKTSLDLVTRRAFDSPSSYAPHRKVGATSLYNYSGTLSDNFPFMYSDGAITLFGQQYARVKSGSITINNNITQQRFIGNTSRQVMSAHIPAQRTYELSLTLLITDTTIWDELRKQDEYDATTGKIKISFTKDSGELLELELDDYIIQSTSIPFPDDKGPIEVELTASARTLSSAKYTGKWIILNTD